MAKNKIKIKIEDSALPFPRARPGVVLLYRDLGSREEVEFSRAAAPASQLLAVPGAECRHMARTGLESQVVSSTSAHGLAELRCLFGPGNWFEKWGWQVLHTAPHEQCGTRLSTKGKKRLDFIITRLYFYFLEIVNGLCQ